MTRRIRKVGNFSSSNHHGKNIYSCDGLCPTLCSGSVVKNGLNILLTHNEKKDLSTNNRKINHLGTTNGHQSGDVYGDDGLSPALCAWNYKSPIKIMEGNNMNKKIIEDNFAKIDEGKYITSDKEKESCYALTSAQRGRPLSKKQDNYVLETEPKTIKLRETTSKGYKEAKVGDGVATDRVDCTVRRGVAHDGQTGALNCQKGNWGTVTPDYRIRRLTPRECERLQAFPDDWTKYGKDGEEISDTQRYKCLGNAVTTTVITHLVNEMFKDLNE